LDVDSDSDELEISQRETKIDPKVNIFEEK
jgi:hypothetical protein